MACILWLTWLFVFAALGVEARAVHMLSTRSATDLYPQTPLHCLFWDRIPPSCLGQLWISSGSQAGLAFAPVQPRAPEHLELQVLCHKAPRQTCLHLCWPTSRAHPLSTMESRPPLASPSLCKFISVMMVLILHQQYWACLGMAFMPHVVIYLFMDFLLLYEFHENYQPWHSPHLPLQLENEKLPTI